MHSLQNRFDPGMPQIKSKLSDHSAVIIGFTVFKIIDLSELSLEQGCVFVYTWWLSCTILK